MNKQQLASKIWASANKMRSNIEASEYKDYILGFIFYKYLCEKEVNHLLDIGWEKEELKELTEDDTETVNYLKKNIGYFIEYKNLFSTWLDMKSDFDVGLVKDAISAFDRNIHSEYKNVFTGIFDQLSSTTKLGNNTKAQTKSVRDLIDLIKDIPMDDKQDYDVLGFIYEYLIYNFAANAGKKGGEFYTPFEVSLLMSEIVADHLKDKKEIKIYDPTSGSGSLLINIGKSISKHNADMNIKYYAQELKTATYNLTRMNLVMRGILPSNIITRCGDTLDKDWPFFDENNDYDPLFLDAVVSNPPYSQPWNPENVQSDPRFEGYGYAPKSKADYAFLLHDLYHLRDDGIMTIVLPHGVLFRGGEEEKIRTNLIENNNIYAIIGLPSNIFFGTGIPTIVMVLKKKRNDNDVLFIDASKYFIKDGKNNKLQQSDIKRIIDAYLNRKDIEKFARLVSKNEIKENGYNLNIPRYVDSSEEPENIDLYSTMFGGIPISEIEEMHKYWNAFPTLKEELFDYNSGKHSLKLKTTNIKETILNNADVKHFISTYKNNFNCFNLELRNMLFNDIKNINVGTLENDIADIIFDKIKEFTIVDKYDLYQHLDDSYKVISVDLETIKLEGEDCINKVDPKIIIKKKGDEETEYQDGYEGHILSFDLIKENYFKDDIEKEEKFNNRLSEIASETEEIFDSLSDEDKEKEVKDETLVNGNGDGFNNKVVKALVKPLLKDKNDYEEDSLESKLIKVDSLIEEEKQIKKDLKDLDAKLKNDIKNKLESLTKEECFDMLEVKWISPVINSINEVTDTLIEDLASKVNELSKKYEVTMCDIEKDIKNTSNELADMIDELTGDEYDMLGLKEFQKLLRGDVDYEK